jgi:hypothetical protein
MQTLLDGCWRIEPSARVAVEQAVVGIKAIKISELDTFPPWPLQV